MKIIVPLYAEMWKKKKKKYYYNLNNYRNRHYIINNNIKKKFKQNIKEQCNFQVDYIQEIHYQLYYPDKRKRDKGNILSIIQKFFLDAIVEFGCISDDCDKYIWKEIFYKPLYEKGNGRCEITIIKKV